MPLGFEETMQCRLKIVWSKVGIIAASKYTEQNKKTKSLQDHTKINSYEKKKKHKSLCQYGIRSAHGKD